MEEKLPIYKIVLDEKTLDHGLDFVSLVKDPAIQEMGMAFNKQERYTFKTNKDKQIVIGPAMIPDMPLYRRDGDGYEYYVVFTSEVIEQLVEKFNKEPREYRINVDHETVVQEAFIKSNWIKEDKDKDKSNLYGFENLPVGTWFVEVKVDDPLFWEQEIKTEGKFGFSVEGLFEFAPMEFNKNKKDEMEIKDLTQEEIEMINKFRNESNEEVVTETEQVELEEVKEELSEEVVEDEEVVVEAEESEEDKDEEVEAAEEDGVIEEVAPEDEVVVEEGDEPLSLDKVMEAVQPKIDEVIKMVAELKSMVEGKSLDEEEVEVELSSIDSKVNTIKAYRKQFSQN